MIHIKSFCFGPFMENTFLLYDDTDQCLVVDPGCYEKSEQEEVTSFIAQKGLSVVGLVNTHCHIDHVLGNKFIKDTYHVNLTIHQSEEPLLRSVSTYAANYGFPNYLEASADSFVEEGDQISFGDSELMVLSVPGHSPGHIMLYNTTQKICIGGDVLFRNSIGRTDLPGGDHESLISNIKSKVFNLDENMTVYCGHGPETTIGYEKEHNPFVGHGA